MKMIKAIAEIDAKRFLRVSWVCHISVLIGVSCLLIFFWPDRMPGWMTVLPILCGAVAVEAAAAAGGSSVKRLTEAVVRKAENGEAEK